MSAFSTFWPFSAKPFGSGRVLSSVTTRTCAGYTLVLCDSKMARKCALFSCPLLAWICELYGELAVEGRVEGFKLASLGVIRLA